MAIHPLVLAGAGSAFILFITLAWSSQLLYDKRLRLQRVRTATGKRQGRIVTSTGLKPQKNTQLQQGALTFMKASTKGFSIMKGRQINETRKRLVSGGFRSRDAIVVYTFFKLVSPLIFLGAPRSTSTAPTRSARAPRSTPPPSSPQRCSAARRRTSSSRTCARSGSRASARRCPTRSTCW